MARSHLASGRAGRAVRASHRLPDKPYPNAEAFLVGMAKATVTILEGRASRD
jgi:hypothetical protein